MKNNKKMILLAFLSFSLASCGTNVEPQGHVHNYVESVVNPTCEDRGYTAHVCVDCGYEYHDLFVDAFGHSYQTYIKTVGDLEANAGDEVYECIRCQKEHCEAISDLNVESKGVDSFHLKNEHVSISCHYQDSHVYLLIDGFNQIESGEIYYTFDADYGLFYHKAYKLSFFASGLANTYSYENGSYPYLESYITHFSVNQSANRAAVSFIYSDYSLDKETAFGNFAFYPLLNDAYNTFEYEHLNPYVVKTASETWIKVNKSNRCYYSTRFQNRHIDDWSRPDITKAETNWTFCCRASTPEEAIVLSMVAEEKGATNIDVNLLYLKPVYLNITDLSKIFKSFKDIGTIAIYYNGDVSHEERLVVLKLAVEAGAGGIDFQGFIYHSGSTIDTQTDENRAYWENLGYDMCFVDASPKETIIDPTEDAKQIDYINQIHLLGGKVLQSMHTGVQFTRRQAVALGEFVSHRGVDIIKIVCHAYNAISLEDIILANKDAYYNPKITAKYSIHSNNSSISDISRLIGPLFYHTYMVFHYVNLCHLQMVMDILHSGLVFDDNTPVKEAIEMIRGYSRDPELNYLINMYRTISPNYTYAYGAGSDMSDRWSFSGLNSTIQFRDASGTNSFSIRGGAVASSFNGKDFEIETKLSGYFKPYTSSVRLPKVGLYIGNQEKMIAFTYNYRTSGANPTRFSLGVVTNSSYFGMDKKKADALDTHLIDEVDIDSDIVNGDSIILKLKYIDGDLSLFYKTNVNDSYTLVHSFTYDEIKNYFTHENDKSVVFGNVCEVYMGSASVGVVNYVTFTNTLN